MRNNDDRKKQNRRSSPSIQEVKQESDTWGVDWIESCRKIRDDESSVDTKKRVSDRKPYSESQAGNNRDGVRK